MAQLLDGKEISAQIRQEIAGKIGPLDSSKNPPTLAIIVATEDASTHTYVRIIKKAGQNAGIKVQVFDLGKDPAQSKLVDQIKQCATDQNIHGIIIQTPLPAEVDADALRSMVPPEKDIDGANPLSAGRLFSKLEAFAPATAQAVIEILKYYDIKTKGKHAVVIGRSRIVGKPVAQMLLDLDSTVTICHSSTQNLASYTRSADILVVAAGQTNLVSAEHINADKQTVVIDVGTNFDQEDKLVGDTDFNQIKDLSGAITPVPGGVGPVTTAILLKNTLNAYLKQTN